jgi:hypothetical protein
MATRKAATISEKLREWEETLAEYDEKQGVFLTGFGEYEIPEDETDENSMFMELIEYLTEYPMDPMAGYLQARKHREQLTH